MVVGWSVADGNNSRNVVSEIKETVALVSNSTHNGLSFSLTCTVKGLTQLCTGPLNQVLVHQLLYFLLTVQGPALLMHSYWKVLAESIIVVVAS